ncbi:MAG: zinc ribbon domain-containing protein [Myxococcota bacterium]|nr:zinc ribbon domain-containing protein [Myxococcota bacterium]
MKPDIAQTLRIVPQELWNKAVEKRQKTKEHMRNAQNRAEILFGDRVGKSIPDHLFSGFLNCSKCGSNFILASGKNGGYYGCADYYQGTKTCTNKALIKKDRLENSLLSALDFIISRQEWLGELANKANHHIKTSQKNSPRTRKNIQAKLNEVSEQINNLVGFIASGKNSDAVSAELARKEREQQLLESELRKLAIINSQQKKLTPEALEAVLSDFFQKLKEQPQSIRLELSKLFPEGVTLTPPSKEKNDVGDFWKADLTMNSSEILYLDAYKVGALKPENPSQKSTRGHSSINKSFSGVDGTRIGESSK